jgi:hypothetical protein
MLVLSIVGLVLANMVTLLSCAIPVAMWLQRKQQKQIVALDGILSEFLATVLDGSPAPAPPSRPTSDPTPPPTAWE